MFTLRNRPEARPWQQPYYISWMALALFCIIGVLPVVLMYIQSFITEDGVSLNNYRILFTETGIFNIFVKSCLLGILAVVFTVIFGLPLAVYLVKYDFTGRRFLSLAFLAPLFIPPHVHTAAWLALLEGKGSPLTFLHINLHSLLGASFILFLSYFPLFVLAVMTGLKSMDSMLEEVGKLNVEPLKVFRQITLPLCTPYLISGIVFVFIFTFFNFGVPSMLEITSLPVELFNRFGSIGDGGGVTALSTPLIIIAFLLLLFQKQKMVKKSYVRMQPGVEKRKITPYMKDRRVTAFVWLFFLVAVVLPLVALLIQAGGLQSYQVAWVTSVAEIRSSVILSIIAATIATVLALFIATYVHECETRWGGVIDAFCWLPFAFPAIFFAIGFNQLWSRGDSGLIQSTALLLVLVYICRFIPFAIRILLANIQQLNPRIKEAAAMCEENRIKRFLFIDLPLLRNGLGVCWLVIFIFSMGELGATLLVFSPERGTISSKIFTLMQYGDGRLVAAFSLILVLINVFAASLIFMTRPKK